jgi:lipoprotein-releasing system permease protein
MAGKYEFWIGSRYVRSRSSNAFVSLISAISMLGITVAVAVLILVLSVVNGFERELQDRLLAMTAHASIESADGRLHDWRSWVEKAEEHIEVAAAAPFVTGQGLLVLGDRLSGAQFSGIEPQLESRGFARIGRSIERRAIQRN